MANMTVSNTDPHDQQSSDHSRPLAYAAGPWTKHALFGGQGEVKVWDLLGISSAPPFKAALWCELEAGGTVGRHRQQDYPEIVICLSGFGTATVDQSTYQLKPGVCIFLPLGSLLSLSATPEQSINYLIIKAQGESSSS